MEQVVEFKEYLIGSKVVLFSTEVDLSDDDLLKIIYK